MDPIMVDFPVTPRSNSLKLIESQVHVPRPSSQISNFSPQVWFWWLRATNFTPLEDSGSYIIYHISNELPFQRSFPGHHLRATPATLMSLCHVRHEPSHFGVQRTPRIPSRPLFSVFFSRCSINKSRGQFCLTVLDLQGLECKNKHGKWMNQQAINPPHQSLTWWESLIIFIYIF